MCFEDDYPYDSDFLSSFDGEEEFDEEKAEKELLELLAGEKVFGYCPTCGHPILFTDEEKCSECETSFKMAVCSGCMNNIPVAILRENSDIQCDVCGSKFFSSESLSFLKIQGMIL